MADAVARELRVSIGGVFAPRLSEASQVLLQHVAPNPEQRADDRSRHLISVILDSNPGLNGPKAAHAGTPNHSQEHCFSLIVERVSSRNFVETNFGTGGGSEKLLKKIVSELAGGCLEAEVLLC